MPAFISAFLWGLLFAVGLGIAGMTQPAKIIAFLDIAGDWDPSLLFVMGGAVMLGLAAFPWIVRRNKPLWADRFHLPRQQAIDRALLLGAMVFGIGWGLAGYCPGPALVALTTFSPHAAIFVICMAAGLYLGDRFNLKSDKQ